MVAGAARGHDDAVDLPQLLRAEVESAEVRGRVVGREPAAHRVGERLRLLVNLLQHVVREVALLRVAVAQEVADVAHRHGHRGQVLVANLPVGFGERADLPVAEVHHLVREAGERVGVAGEVVAVVADPDDERAAEARADDQPRFGFRHHRDAVGALDQGERVPHGRDEIAVVMPADEVREHFGVGVRAEPHAGGLELVLERGEVLDDAVVDEGDVVGRVRVRVRVAVGGAAVGGPAGVADAVAPRRRVRGDVPAELREPPGLLAQVQFVAGARDEAGAIVPAVLQAPQPFQQHRRRFAPPGEPDDPAHA